MHYGPVMIDLEGTELTPQEQTLLKHPAVGAVVLTDLNAENNASLKKLVQQIRQQAKNPLLICYQTERLSTPPPDFYKKIKQNNSNGKAQKEMLKLAEAAGHTAGSELLACGINCHLMAMPTLGDNPSESCPTTEWIVGCLQGMKKSGMATLASYSSLFGTDPRPLEALLSQSFLQFTKLKISLDAIMPAPIIYSEIDNVPPAYSKQWLEGILRGKLNYQGAIISDCSAKKGFSVADLVVKIRLALDAGCDMIRLLQVDRTILSQILDRLDRLSSRNNQQRLKGLAINF